jgi:hypothetical protein
MRQHGIGYIHPTLSNSHGSSKRCQCQPNPLPHRRGNVCLALVCLPRIVTHHHPKPKVHGEEGHKLRVAARHAISFPHHLCRPILPNEPLEHPVQRFTCHLSREHEQDLHLTRRPDQGSIGDAKGLRNESEVGACVRDLVCWVVVDVREGERGKRRTVHRERRVCRLVGVQMCLRRGIAVLSAVMLYFVKST